MIPTTSFPDSPQDGEFSLYNNHLWQYAEGFPHAVANLDSSDLLMIAVDNGSWNRYGVKLFRYIVASGQSNLNLHDVDSTSRSPHAALFDGVNLVSLPTGKDNPVTRAAEILSVNDGLPTVLIYENRGNTKIEAWIDEDDEVDMFARLKAKTDAFESLFENPPHADAFVWFHGGSNDFDKVVTPDGGYPAKYKILEQKLLQENFCSAETMFFTGEIAANGITDTVNIAQQVMKISGEFHNYNIVPYRYRSTFDRFHFDQQTINSECLANAIQKGGSDYFNALIDRPIQANIDYFGGNLVRAIRFFEQFKFVDEGHVELIETKDRFFENSQNITGLNTSKITLNGNGKTWSFPKSHGIICNNNFKISELHIKGGPIDKRFGVICYLGVIQFDNVIISEFSGDRSQSVNLTSDGFATGSKLTQIGNTRNITSARSDILILEALA